jgi:hypothetical protein
MKSLQYKNIIVIALDFCPLNRINNQKIKSKLYKDSSLKKRNIYYKTTKIGQNKKNYLLPFKKTKETIEYLIFIIKELDVCSEFVFIDKKIN